MKTVQHSSFSLQHFPMLRIHLLGHLRLFYNNQPLKFAALPKTLPLWGYLLLNRTDPIPRDTLAFTLWPDVTESEARANLRRHLHELRRVLPPPPPETPWVISQGNTLQWNQAATYWLDVAEFDRLSQLPEHLAEAVELYDGDLLQAVYEDWVFFERERLRNLFFSNLTQLIARHRARGEYTQAVGYALQLLGHDPMREDITRDLMMLRYEAGDRAGSIQEYQRFEERLEEELGVKPMRETYQLYQNILNNTVAKQSAGAVPESFPVSVSSSTPSKPSHNLPAQLTLFVGREEELATIKRLIGPESHIRLLTLTGPGGTGKTRLSIEAGMQMAKESAVFFPDGIFFVGLAAIQDAAFVVTAVAEILKITESPNQTLTQSILSFLRHKKLLLILDNFEQVVEATSFVTEMLTTASDLRILITSRILLHIYGEQEYPVPPLPLPDLEHLPKTAELLKYAAIALFVERVRALQPGFVLTDENAAVIAEICIRLDGLPLALELTAARSKLFSPSILLAQLNNRLRFLVGQTRNLPARQQTLRSTIDWSYTLLTEEEKRVFAYLAVFSGVFTLEAAVSVVTGRPLIPGTPISLDAEYRVVGILNSLVDQSMIRQLALIENDPQPHFRMLFTIRDYAQEKLTERGEMETLRRQHAAYYLVLSQQARQEWGGETQGKWITGLKTAEDNLRACLTWTLQTNSTPEDIFTGAQMALALRPFWHSLGAVSESRNWYTRALAFRSSLSPEIVVNLLLAASWPAVLQGDDAAAEPWLQEALQLARSLNNTTLLADCLAYLAATATRQENYEVAATYFEETVALDRQAEGDNIYNLSASLDNLATVYVSIGADDKALALWQEGLSLARAHKYYSRESNILENLGVLATKQGSYEEAAQMLRQSLQVRYTLDTRIGIWGSMVAMSHLAFRLGQHDRCIRLYSIAETLRQEMGMTLTPTQKTTMEQDITTIRAVLGETAVATAQAEARTLPLNQAIAFALETNP